MAGNAFQQGPYAPVEAELTVFDLPVTGRIPPELNGRYLRNGPNPINLDDPGYGHWFTGPGMLHGVRLRDGKAEWYRNRWVRSRAVSQELKETWPGGPDFDGNDFAANTHILHHAGKLLATVEAGALPYEITPDLRTVGPCDFGGTLPGDFAAHTKIDTATGDLHAVAYYWAWNDHVQHIVVGTDGKVKSTTDVPVPDGPMMHDFALTPSYVVLMDLPITFSMDRAMAGDPLPYRWNPDHPPRLGLLPRDGGGEVRWFGIEPCFVYHTFNAYEEAGKVVLDVVRYDGAYDLASLRGGALTLSRYTIDPADGTVRHEPLNDRLQEFPRIDERLVGARHRYGYSAVINDGMQPTLDGKLSDDAFKNVLLRYDFLTRAEESHDFGRDATAGEAVFVPSRPDSAEDDGYLMAYVHDPGRGSADLVILAAQDFAGEPVARVHLPARIPIGLHGNWVPDS
ncbi:carotenoid oxygenase family protein [Nonomuraea sp. NPDC050663]|uniref:carotenoid oxygenase family protein n=1 Tax=Nonomuraea sp. NPDC050663 TaxID=3364370 RepID=UPI0037980EE2